MFKITRHDKYSGKCIFHPILIKLAWMYFHCPLLQFKTRDARIMYPFKWKLQSFLKLICLGSLKWLDMNKPTMRYEREFPMNRITRKLLRLITIIIIITGLFRNQYTVLKLCVQTAISSSQTTTSTVREQVSVVKKLIQILQTLLAMMVHWTSVHNKEKTHKLCVIFHKPQVTDSHLFAKSIMFVCILNVRRVDELEHCRGEEK